MFWRFAAAIRLRRQIRGEWLLALAGVLSIVLAGLFAFSPLAAALTVALWFGAYSMVFGMVMIILAFRLRSRGRLALATGISMPLPSH